MDQYSDVVAAAVTSSMTSSEAGSLRRYGLAHLLVTSLVLGVIVLATIVGNVFVIAAISRPTTSRGHC